MPVIGIVAIFLLALIAIVMLLVYNRLTILKNRNQNALAQIDVQPKRRYDLIPNLVNSAKAYLTHERETLEEVIKARNLAAGALEGMGLSSGSVSTLNNVAAADLSLGQALGRLMVVMENNPTLKADKTVSELSEELRSTENRVSFARQAYNDSVMIYNQTREVFPNVLFIGMFGFEKAGSWVLGSPHEANAPVVNL
ncbi:MAG: LemA family protein [Deltaproteobacteria bacterium]|jgi:LemA protein|nr:LemA family protein [Deltaproteobacteria bacterium]